MEHIVEQDLELQAVIGFQGKSTSQETLSFHLERQIGHASFDQ